MPILINLIISPEHKGLRDKFIFPIRDEDNGLLKFDINSPQYANIFAKGSIYI